MTDENTLRTEGDLAFISALAECAIAHGKTILTKETAVSLLSVVGNLSKALAAQPRDDVREAFKAGWRTNAVGEDVQPASYLDGCEQTDWEEYQRVGIDAYCTALAPTTQGTDSGLAGARTEEANRVAEYADQSYVEGVRDLADMIERDKTANWLAVANVLRDCAAIMERDARAKESTQ